MQHFLLATFLFGLHFANAQIRSAIDKTVLYSSLSNGKFYIVGRGTKTKASLIGKKFNITDSNLTHVGIGFVNEGNLKIYHVSDVSDASGNALRLDSIESFLFSDDVFYFAVWECNNTVFEFERLKAICSEMSKRKIYFDGSFIIRDDDTLYCSEFCATVLRKTSPGKYDFLPKKILIGDSFYGSVLKRQILSYIAVDFFQTSKYFTKVYEYSLKNK